VPADHGADWPTHEAADAERAATRLAELQRERQLRPLLARLAPSARLGLVRVLGYSDFLYRFLCRCPQALDGLDAAPPPPPGDDAGALRDFKYRELLRIAVGDLGAARDYAEVLTALSQLAEVIVRQVVAATLGGSSRGGRPPCVLALGKLGARELNLSSDIDLIFLADADRGDGAAYADYLQQAVHDLRALVQRLEARSEQGFLYRVDLRLRPWGEDGPLLLSAEAMENYYAARPDPMERLAWLRARPLAGTEALGRELLHTLQPFLYLRSLDSTELQRLLQLKQRLAARRQRLDTWDVKTGEGGIRDVEFFIHALQLLYGARHPGLRTTVTLQALHGLTEAGLLPAAEAVELHRAYLFLRRLENHLQLIDEQQTHGLPLERTRRRLVARALLGNRSADPLEVFEEQLAWSRSVARACFERVLPAADGGELP